ncbi:radical SAM protein [Treponema pedis str. T A4]|uniref:Radical SAM protein n=5 Tax=Treponema pedis TaxID=409322 RepID=S6A3R0_9SPIR|nr:radical SAM protein [Treponema pedis str. T A4]
MYSKSCDSKFLKRYIDYNIQNNGRCNSVFDFIKQNYFNVSHDYMENMKFPLQVGLNVTNKCNLKCVHCSKKNKNEDMLNWKEIIDICKNKEVLNIYLTGGEPFLHNDILEIIKYIKEKKITLSILTNGILLTEHICRNLAALLNNNTDYMQISIDSVYDKYELYRNKASFNILDMNIDILKKYNIPIRVNCVISKKNSDSFEDVYNYIKSKGIKYLRFTPFVENKNSFERPACDNDILKPFIKIYESAINDNICIYGDPIKNVYGLLKKYEYLTLTKQIKLDKFICPEGKISCEIDVNGDIYGCTYFVGSDKKICNIFDKNIIEMFYWYQKNKSDNILAECKICKYKKLCMCGYPAIQAYKLQNTRLLKKYC